MRIGVESGEVLVDLERVRGPRDRMLTGDAVNMAARLQTAAEPGHVDRRARGVYAAHQGRDRVPGAAGRSTLKGKAEPVPAWRALRVKARSARRAAAARAWRRALVGRDEELTVLSRRSTASRPRAGPRSSR